MIKNKSLNKDILSNQTLCNRRKALEIILFGGHTNNKAIQNIVESVNQQTLEFIKLKELITSSKVNFSEIYNMLNGYGKGSIPVIIATVLKEHALNLVIEKNEKEVVFNVDTLEQIEKEPERYSLEIIQNTIPYEKIKDIFGTSESDNLFEGIVNALQEWFFSTCKYSNIVENTYIGKGMYKSLDNITLKLKEMLRSIQENPYWFLKYKVLPLINQSDFEKLRLVKDNVDNTIESLKSVLLQDINYVFPESISVWYSKLPTLSKKKIYHDGEERFLNICKNADNNFNLIDDLAFYLTGLPISNWNDNTPSIFYERLKNIKSTIDCSKKIHFEKGFDIKFINNSKEKTEFIFDLPRSNNIEIINLLKRDIVSMLKEYGNSISNSDKIESILEVILEVGDCN